MKLGGQEIGKIWELLGEGKHDQNRFYEKSENTKEDLATCSSNLTWVLMIAEISVKYFVNAMVKAFPRLSRFNRVHILCPLQPSGAFKDEDNYTHSKYENL